MRRGIILGITLLCATIPASAQNVKGGVAEDAAPRPLDFRGIVPGESTLQDVLSTMGEPLMAAHWYNYKLTYASDRDGLYDVFHMQGDKPDSLVANIACATIPKGYENGEKIRTAFGEPEYLLKMKTWALIDYSEQGLRFTVDHEGMTTGVVHFPHGWPRVHPGARKVMDLSTKRSGFQSRPTTAPDLDGLRCGAAEVIYSPQDDDWLPYKYEVHQDLKGRIAVFQRDSLTVGFVGADLFGFGFGECNIIRDAAREIGVDYLVFASSHSHSTGDVTGFYGHYPTKYVEHLIKQVVGGIGEAMENLEPVTRIRTISEELPMDGGRVHGLIRNARNPALMDPTMNVVMVDGEDGTIATIVNFACHPESVKAGAEEIDADFPGYMCTALQEAGGFGQPIFLNGALGGMVSGDNPERTHESSKETGEIFAALVQDLAERATSPQTFEFSAMSKRLEVPLTNAEWVPFFELDYSLRSPYRGRIITDMTYIQIGEAQFISIPGELLPEVSFEILEQMDGYPRILIGLGNDQLGYMVPPYDFREGVYEEKTSVGPSMALQVRDTAHRMIRGVR